MPLLSGYSPPHRHNAGNRQMAIAPTGWLQPLCWFSMCHLLSFYIQGTIEEGRFARVIEDGIPLWGPKSEEPAFLSCLDPCLLEFSCISACRSLRNLSSSEHIQTSNLLYINAHQCTSYTNLFMVLHFATTFWSL